MLSLLSTVAPCELERNSVQWIIMNIKTIQEIARLGGRASWKGVSKEERSKRMRKLAQRRWKSIKKVIPT